MRLLFLLPYVFIPPDKGNKHLIFNLLKYVTKDAECDLILLVDGDADKEDVRRNIRSEFPSVGSIRLFDKPTGLRRFAARLRALACGFHPAIGRYWSQSLAEWMKNTMSPHSYDIVHFDMFHMAQYRRYAHNIPSVLVPSDAYSLSFGLAIKAAPNLTEKIKTFVEGVLLANYETRTYPKFDLICPVSKIDADHLREQTHHTNIRVIGIAIGGEFVARPPRAFEERSQGTECRILYAGGIQLGWVAECLLQFLEKAYPKIRRAVPNVCLTVLGRNPSHLLRRVLESEDSVHHIEFVDRFIEFLEQDWVYVHAQKTNAGFQTKVQQAMALGLPVVGFELAFSGMEVESGKHCFICQTQDQIADATMALLRDSDLRRKIGFAAAYHIREKYSVKRVGEEMMQCYRDLASA